jgi:hypothetical protein
MSLFTITLVIWSAATTVLVLLLIYRSTLSIHEDDQLFLDESEAHLEREQREVLDKVAKVNPMIRLFGSASGVLVVVIGGLWIYESLTAIQ